MILLTSDGITSTLLEDKIWEALPGISHKAALVTTASRELKERDENVPILSEIMERMGLCAVCVDVEFEDASVLLQYDVVILMGGDPFYLKRHLRKWPRCREILIELADRHVLVGFSAGSMVLGNTMEYAALVVADEISQDVNPEDMQGFGIVPYNIMPHYKAYLTVYPGMDQLLADYKRETHNQIQHINDKEGICISKSGRKGLYLKNACYEPEIYCNRKELDCDYYVFDLYGTLIDIHTEEGEEGLWQTLAGFYRCKGAFYEAYELKTCFDRLIASEEALTAETLAAGQLPEPQIERAFDRLYLEKGVSVCPETVIDTAQLFRCLSMKYIRLYYGVKPLLKHLKRRGKKLYVLSNAQQVFTEPEMRYLGIYDAFDKILFSSDYHCKKPDPAFFGALIESQGLDPARGMMIGNSARDDMETAAMLGMKTCYIHSNLSDPEDCPRCDLYMKEMDLPLLEKLLCK